MKDRICESVERLQRHQMIDSRCNHIWNAHRQCQWCHGMQRDYDVMIVANAFSDALMEIDRLQRAVTDLTNNIPLLDNRTRNEARKLLNEPQRITGLDGVERCYVQLELAKEVIESLLAENNQLKQCLIGPMNSVT